MIAEKPTALAGLTTSYAIEIELISEMLGTVPKDPQIYSTYIASRAASPDNEDELETVPVSEEQGWTGFHTLDGKIGLYDYVIKGFIKESMSHLRRVPGSLSGNAKLRAFKRIVDGTVFVEPRFIPVETSGDLIVVERSLRAQTAQGERVALAKSDAAPAGSRIKFTISVLGDLMTEDVLHEVLAYGSLHGLGQWRNSGAGRFSVISFERAA